MEMNMNTNPHEDVDVTVKTVLLDVTFMEWSVLTGLLSAIVVLSVNLLK